jgi:hypothetical protein
MNVSPLPDNAPSSFQGAVGQFDIQAQADTAATEVNETVTLHVALRGQGNMNGVADPQWAEGPEWRAFDSKATVNTQFADGVMSGVRSYERLLVPTQPGDLLLPAIEFSFFNPQTESYETASSEPIIIHVTGTVGAGATPLTSEDSAATTVNTAVGASSIPEFRSNKPASELGHNSAPPLTGNAGYWLLWTLPLFLLVGSFGLSRYRRQRLDTADVRRSQSAVKRAKQALRDARKQAEVFGISPEDEANEAAGRILTRYLEEKLNVSMTGQTQTDLARTLSEKGLNPALAERVQICLTLSEMGRYAPTGINAANSDLLSETEQVITELDKEL